MSDNEKIQDIIEASEDTLLQKIIDRQEGALGLEELNRAGPAPTQAELAHWEQELDKLCAEKSADSIVRGRRWGRAVLLTILAALFLLAAASALYRPILNWVESVHEKYTRLQAGETAESQVAQWENAYIPERPPDGFSISDAVDLDDIKYIEYANSGGGRITFYQYGPCSSVSIDTEKADKILTTWVDGQTAYLFQKAGLSTIYWDQGGCILSIEYNVADIQESEIKAFAASVQWRPNKENDRYVEKNSIAVAVSLSVLLVAASPAAATAPAYTPATETVIEFQLDPRFDHMSRISSSLSVRDFGRANCTGSFTTYDEYDSTITITLQQFIDSKWTDIKEWSEDFTGSGVKCATKAKRGTAPSELHLIFE